ncbi:MAG TPA: response regulator, partial [Pyrinomonadaceae bacterium]|nr:response regulator [Pyrinomonadaceae bacterium]
MPNRVLIVDDEENIREMTRLALEAAGYEVGEAGSGLEAFAVLGADEAWDAVLLDQKMPGLVGTEVLRRLKVLLPGTPVIMMTAYASVDLAVDAMKLGASDFVRKPMTPEILRNALAAALDKSKASGQSKLKNGEQSTHVTLNGFTIMRSSDSVGVIPHRPNERCFVVRKPNGQKQQVVVEIHSDAVAAVEKETNDLPLAKAFWTE